MSGPMNPCKRGRYPWLAPIGDRLALFFIERFEEPTDGCPCCIAIRILTLTAAALGLGIAIGVFL